MGKISTFKSSLRVMEGLYGAIDRSLVSLYGRSDVPCKKGCCDCCYQLVTASIIEALYILIPLAKDKEKAGIFNQFILPKIKEQAELMEKATVDSWWKKEIPCVFLSSELCSIYSRRPVACRTCIVIGTQERCSRGSIKEVMKFDHREMTAEGIKASTEVSDKLGIPTIIAPLPVSLGLATRLLNGGVSFFRSYIRGTVYENALIAASYWAKIEPNGSKYLERPSLPLPKIP